MFVHFASFVLFIIEVNSLLPFLVIFIFPLYIFFFVLLLIRQVVFFPPPTPDSHSSTKKKGKAIPVTGREDP
jgi:hypothetical protein